MPDWQLFSPCFGKAVLTPRNRLNVSANTWSGSLPFLRQVPSKAQWIGRKHSKGRKIRIFAHESPLTESSHHHAASAKTPLSIGWPRVPRFAPTTNLGPPPAPRPQTPSVTGFLCAWDPLLWNPNSSSPCWARYTEEILLSAKLKTPFKKDKHTDHLLFNTSCLN